MSMLIRGALESAMLDGIWDAGLSLQHVKHDSWPQNVISIARAVRLDLGRRAIAR
jgi:hypothetical protein